MPCIFVAYDLSMSSKLAPHPRLPTTRIARLELGLLLGFRHSHARSRKRSTLFSRMEEELVVPSPSAPGFARQLLSDIVDVERRVLYETMQKSDLTFGMVKGEDGRNRFNIIEFWRTREHRHPLAFPVYSALPTEANCERVFSRIGNKTWIICGATRNPRHCPHW
jgi:hypothetical protein